MNILFEELAAPERAGGVEAATRGLRAALESLGARVARPAIGEAMPAGKPDCVHVHGIWSPALYRRCRHWEGLGVPCVVTVHGMLEPWAFAYKRWKKRLAWLVYQKAWLNRAFHLLGFRPNINKHRFRFQTHLVEHVPVSDLCDKHKLHSNSV